MKKYIDRYQQGEYREVWAELFSMGELIRSEPIYTDALAVARETMSRVKKNVEKLIPRLLEIGYKFGVYPNSQEKIDGYSSPHAGPVSDQVAKIANYEKLDGITVFPLSLRCFWEIVGEIDFSGWNSTFPRFADPLIVFPVNVIDCDYYEWRKNNSESGIETNNYEVPISPDYLHKDNISGGVGYKLKVPDMSIDGVLLNERHKTTFVNYLRIAFQYGGFPGIGLSTGRKPDIIDLIIQDLMPL